MEGQNMSTVNYLSKGEGTLGVNYTLNSLNAPAAKVKSLMLIEKNMIISADDYALLKGDVEYVGVSEV